MNVDHIIKDIKSRNPDSLLVSPDEFNELITHEDIVVKAGDLSIKSVMEFTYTYFESSSYYLYDCLLVVC